MMVVSVGEKQVDGDGSMGTRERCVNCSKEARVEATDGNGSHGVEIENRRLQSNVEQSTPRTLWPKSDHFASTLRMMATTRFEG
jgi:hypothetical protein